MALLRGTCAGPEAAVLVVISTREPLAIGSLSHRAPPRRRGRAGDVLNGGGSEGSKAAEITNGRLFRLGLSPRAVEGLKNGAASGLATVRVLGK